MGVGVAFYARRGLCAAAWFTVALVAGTGTAAQQATPPLSVWQAPGDDVPAANLLKILPAVPHVESLHNGGFEQGNGSQPAGWSCEYWPGPHPSVARAIVSRTRETVRDGEWALLANMAHADQSGQVLVLRQTVDVTNLTGKRVRFTAQCMLRGKASASGDPVGLVLRQWKDGKVVRWDQKDVRFRGNEGTWVQGVVEADVLADCDCMDVKVDIHRPQAGNAAAVYLIDATSLAPVEEPALNMTPVDVKVAQGKTLALHHRVSDALLKKAELSLTYLVLRDGHVAWRESDAVRERMGVKIIPLGDLPAGKYEWVALLEAGGIGSVAIQRQAVEIYEGPFAPVLSDIHYRRSVPEATSSPRPAVVMLTPTAQPPLIDGKLDDPCWRQSASFSNFVVLQSTTPAQENRKVRMTFDRLHLYIAVELDKAPGYILKALTRKNDRTEMWTDDELEIFLDPGPSYSEYYQIIINAAGHFCDLKHLLRWQEDAKAAGPNILTQVTVTDDSWVSDVRYKVEGGSPEDKVWTLEVCLPVRALGLPGIPLGSRWGVNLASNNRRTHELTNWVPGAWHNPNTYGQIVFGQAPLTISPVSFGDMLQGTNTLDCRGTNMETQTRQYLLELETWTGEKKLATRKTSLTLEPGQTGDFQTSYTLAAGATQVSIKTRIQDEQGRLLFYAQRSATPPPPLKLRVDAAGYCLDPRLPITGRLEVRLGRMSLAKASVELTLHGPNGLARQQTLQPRDISADFSISMADLPVGRYQLQALLRDDAGQHLAQQEADFSITDSPFAP